MQDELYNTKAGLCFDEFGNFGEFYHWCGPPHDYTEVLLHFITE